MAGLDGGVGQVPGFGGGLSQLPGLLRVNTGRLAAGGRLLFPLTRQGLGDGAAPHQAVT